MTKLTYDIDRSIITVEDNIEQTLPTVVQELDSESRTFAILSLPMGNLIISSGTSNRVAVDFASNRPSKDGVYAGTLTDPSNVKRADIIVITVQDEDDDRPIYLTIEKSEALNVAMHFLKHGILSKSERWNGNIPDELLSKGKPI